MLLQIFKKIQRLQGCRGYEGFIGLIEDFPLYPRGCEVTEVTVLLQILKKIHGLQGCGGYEGFIGLLLKIFPYVPEVARFRKLRCFDKFSKKVLEVS